MTQQIALSLKQIKVHKPTDCMPILLKKGYAILDDRNLHIKIKKHNDFEEHEKLEIKINTYNKK